MKPTRFIFFLMPLALLLFFHVACAWDSDEMLIEALHDASSPTLCGEKVPMEDPQVRERFEKEMLVNLGDRPQVILWLKRASRYFPYIESSLRERGFPQDIKYLAVAESALRLHAGSVKGAMGVWQMMPQTARKFGLEVSGSFDERRNFYMSTRAALTYLGELHDQFGSWALALAAYNMGEEGLEAEMLEQGSGDYYRLYLSIETQRFIFRILAIKQIMEASGRYGFDLSPEEYYAPDVFEPVEISYPDPVPLRLVAQAGETDFMGIKYLNPEIRGHYLAPGARSVNIPPEGVDGFHSRLDILVQAERERMAGREYVVREGDNLSMIAEKFGVPLSALLIWNDISASRVIHPGQRLVVAPPEGVSVEGPDEEEP